MNKFELRALGFVGILLIIFLFSFLYNAYSRKINVPACVPVSKTFSNPGLVKIDDTTYDLYVTAQMWFFTPSEVKVPVGSTVTVYLESKDVVHGFMISRKGVNLMAIPGAINTATMHFSTPGKYAIQCHEYCGTGHQNMLGDIVVTEN